MDTSKERILAAWRGEPHDYVPFTTWSFGFQPPKQLCWEREGQEVKHWFTKRLEHIHTLPQPWELEDDFQRVLAWQSIGVDDILDVSVPWSVHPEVSWKDSIVAAGVLDEQYPVIIREYDTPSGKLTHAIKQTREDLEPGWVLQPENVQLFEDFNIPRGVKHAVVTPDDVRAIKYMYQAPGPQEKEWFRERLKEVSTFAKQHGVAVQAWSGFGMDAVIWLMGVEGAVFMAMEHPDTFRELCDTVHETDIARTTLALETPGVDLVVRRGWYGSTDFWSPKLCDQFYFPYVKDLADLAHRYGKPFGLTMSTGLQTLGQRIVNAGVDVHYFIDPVQGRITLEDAARIFGDRTTMIGGISVVHSTEKPETIRNETQLALETFGKSNRFILHPVDSLYPDTRWEGLKVMIDTWKEYFGLS